MNTGPRVSEPARMDRQRPSSPSAGFNTGVGARTTHLDRTGVWISPHTYSYTV